MLKIDSNLLNTETTARAKTDSKKLFETKNNFFQQYKNLDKILQTNE